MTLGQRQGDDLLLPIRLTPKAKREALGGTWTGSRGESYLSASVTAPPDKGAANAALIAQIAKALSVPASRVALEAGATSRLKRLRILACPPEVEARIAALAAGKT